MSQYKFWSRGAVLLRPAFWWHEGPCHRPSAASERQRRNRSKHTPTWNLHATCVKCRHTNDKLNCSQCRPRPMTHDDLPNIVRDAGSGRVSPTRIPATWVQQKTNHLLMLTTHKIDKHCQNCKHWSSCVCLSSCAWIQRHENNVGRWFGVETLMWPSFVKYELNASACG